MIKLIGQTFMSKQCGWFTVLEKIKHPKESRYLIEFEEVNGIRHQTTTLKKHILSGGIKNPYYPLKLGVACIGNANSKDYPKEFNKWRAMIERCYDIKNNHYPLYGALGVTVCKRWLCFENFLADLPLLEGYDNDKLNRGELHLDKDIKGDSTFYSPETCILTSPSENVKEMNERVKQKQFKAIRISDGHEEVFNSQAEFAKKLGVNQSNVGHCLSGKQKTIRSYKLQYI